MKWKKNNLYFIWQTILYAKNRKHFAEMFSYRQKWISSFEPMRNSVQDEQPWVSFRAQEIIHGLVSSNFKIFEFGGGGSTLFFCKRSKHVVTVEDSDHWFEKLRDIIVAKNITNWRGFLVKSERKEIYLQDSYKNPADFMSGAKGLEGLSFENYVTTIRQFPLEYFDLILIDGRARPSCIHYSIPHLKSGGFLVVDNTERDYYLDPFTDRIKNEFDVLFDERFPTPYSPDFTKTTILRKK